MTDELTIATDGERRLLVIEWTNANGSRFVTVARQYRDRAGQWRLSHSGLILSPEVARALAPALLATAAAIDATPPEPAPTEQDRESSRWP